MNTMTYKESVDYATNVLTHTSDSPALDAQVIICHACDVEQTTVLAHPEKHLSKEQILLFRAALERRCEG